MIKYNKPSLVYLQLKRLIVLFAILWNREYVAMILLHLLFLQYHQDLQHPHVDLFTESLLSFVGEDIEIANRALSHSSVRNSRRSDHELIDKAYRLLRFLRMSGVNFADEMSDYRRILKGGRRYKLNNP